MSSGPTDDTLPSPAAQQALRAMCELSTQDRVWVLEQMESRETLDALRFSPQQVSELTRRLESLKDGTAELHDLEDVEQEALRLLEE